MIQMEVTWPLKRSLKPPQKGHSEEAGTGDELGYCWCAETTGLFRRLDVSTNQQLMC